MQADLQDQLRSKDQCHRARKTQAAWYLHMMLSNKKRRDSDVCAIGPQALEGLAGTFYHLLVGIASASALSGLLVGFPTPRGSWACIASLAPLPMQMILASVRRY